MKLSKIWLPLALVASLAAAAVPVARGEYKELDAIVAIVDEDVVLASELLSRLETVQKQIAASNVQAPPTNVLVSQLMERLVLESLQLQEAERRGVQIDDETLTQAVLNFAQQNGMNLEQLRMALEQDGVSYLEFRDQIRREMIIGRLQRNLVNRRIAISDQDIDDLLDSPYYQQLLSDEFRVGHILLTFPDDDPAAADQAREKADELVADLRDGADFRQMAIANSASSTALEGGDLGWRKAGELPSLFAEQVVQLEVGETADPIVTRGGVHIIQLLEQRGASMQREQQTLARHILVQPSEIRSEAETEALIREIHDRLEAGEDFEALARQYSEDPGSALNGGDLGWSSGDQFVESFRRTMASTPTGGLSPPFRSQYGWHVIEVLDRREQDISEEARRNMATQILHQRRFDEELQEWQRELRDEAFVEVRI
jgi:peptidyl-prolyl cis-trans isomerase SurA